MSSIEVRDLRVGYRSGVLVFDGLGVSVAARRRTALIGANGAGKTTLLRTMSGAVRPNAGTVTVDGRTLGWSRRELAGHRQKVQLVLQDPDDQLFCADVFSDVSFGPTNLGLPASQVRSRVEETLAALGISSLSGRPVHELSFGQKKRVAIAGAVAMKPDYLLLDEPTAGLDPAGLESLLECLEGLERDGTTILMSTHDLDFAWRWADDAVVLRGGRAHQAPVHAVLMDAQALADAQLRLPWQAAMLRCAGAGYDGQPLPRTAESVYAALRSVSFGGFSPQDAESAGFGDGVGA